MPNYPHIMAEIARTPWAISSDALSGILAALDGNLSAKDYPIFHRAPESEQVALTSILGEKVRGSAFSFIDGNVGFLQINGPIIPRADDFAEASGVTSIERLTAEFQSLEANREVERIALVIDSPGGAITGISEFATMLAKSEKPLTAYVYGHAASAAYWIASAADSIIMGDTSAVGSIGVVMTIWKGDDDEVEIISSQSPNKRPDIDSEEGRAELQTMVDQLAEVFIKAVATNRGVDAKAVPKRFGAGGMKLSKAAISSGMADGEMTLVEFVSAVASGEDEKLIAKFDKTLASGENQKSEGSNPDNMKTQEQKMKLSEFLKENPEAAAEIDKIKAEATSAGKEAATREINERNQAVSQLLASDAYPAQIKDIAAKFVAGAISKDHLDGAVAAFDAMKAQQETEAVVIESKNLPATPAQDIKTPSTDGVLRSAEDIDRESEALRGGR